MTDFSAAAIRPDFQPQAGKHNMASRAFAALRAQHEGGAAAQSAASGSGTLSFDDLLDVVNPLQHIPVVSDIYRSLTGDSISGKAQVAGDAIYGGPLGLVSGVVSVAIEAAEGTSPGKALIAAIGGDTEVKETASLPPEADTERQTPAKAQTAAASYDIGPAWREASAGTPPMPQLSPEAFNAVLSAFGKPPGDDVLNTGTTATSGRAEREAEPRLAAADPAPVPPSGFASAMANGLDKYRAMMDRQNQTGAPQ